MKKISIISGLIAILLSLFFGGVAYQELLSENMDDVYMNIGYCTLFLSIAFYMWHVRDEKAKN